LDDAPYSINAKLIKEPSDFLYAESIFVHLQNLYSSSFQKNQNERIMFEIYIKLKPNLLGGFYEKVNM